MSNNRRFGKGFLNTFSKLGLLYNFDPYFYQLKYDRFDGRDIFIFGYFQSESYFYSSKSDVMRLCKVCSKITEKEEFYLSKISNGPCIAVSLRLGYDYTHSDDLNVCDKAYYFDAISKIVGLTGIKTLFIFSDEIDQAKMILNEMEYNDFVFEFISDMDATQSLRLMYNCNHFVISNSSFSWWGAYLSESKDKLIVGPDVWYNNDVKAGDMFSKDIIRLKDL